VKFTPTDLPGAFLIDLEPIVDERGFFARTWCGEEFAEHGLSAALAQCNVSFNRQKGTLRGMHFQVTPHEEAKLVRCTMGAIYDVIVDLRPESPTYSQHLGVELTASNRRALFVPEGCAHGFQTLVDDSEVFYQMSRSYAAGAARGVRWNDPAFAIAWPEQERIISERDQQWPDFNP
jgi:dTDP-4-dehydrorhamnose 3,5-epimerase